MNSLQSLIAASLGFGLVAAGCLGVDGTGSSPFDMLPLEGALSSTDSHNGLYSPDFQVNEANLLETTTRPIKAAAPAGTHALNPQSASILDTAGRRDVFRYAVGCALGAGDSVTGGDPAETFNGAGILSTTAGWGSSALTASQTEDLFTCLLTHLNPTSTIVAIHLKGDSIAQGSDNEDQYGFIEAVWLAESSATSTPASIDYHVWPHQDLKDLCGEKLEASLQARVCGTEQGGCGLAVHDEAHFAANCAGSDGVYSCFGKPAIQIRLKATEAQLRGRHPNCVP